MMIILFLKCSKPNGIQLHIYRQGFHELSPSTKIIKIFNFEVYSDLRCPKWYLQLQQILEYNCDSLRHIWRKNVSHLGVFSFTNPPIFRLMYSTYLRVNRLRSARTTSCRGGFVKMQKPIRPYLGCMLMVCTVCESCETALQCILQTLLRFHRLYNKISNWY